jgi:putative nucleotidyltransferase with HDIG domain
VLYDLESGILFCLISTLLLSLMLGFELKVTLTHFFAGMIAARSVTNIRYRANFFLAYFFYCLAYLVLIAVMGLTQGGEFDLPALLRNFGVAAVSGLFCLMTAMFLIWVFERLFGLTTNLTLIELSDMNSLVLKKLSMEAAGTYHHSVLVGNLAESGAEKVGANPLKTRVLAYYHDIGKVSKAEYFIENQAGMVDSLHEKISPRMSAIIIASHVKQGVELGRKYNLPPAIMDVIREHHGTTLISFFYERAKELEPDKNLLRDDFCYPGPKPKSKETALIMLADSVEAASRTLDEPTASRLKSLVDSIIDGKIADGQLDDCNLTFIDLSEIKKSFVPVLTAMFHARIEYPDSDGKRGAKPDIKKTIKMPSAE